MTYVKTSRQLRQSDNPIKDLQSGVDDVHSLDSVATPFTQQLYQIRVNSGQPLQLAPGFKPSGAMILNTDSQTVSSFKTELRGVESIQITVDFSPASSATFLINVIGNLRNVR
jgi:hypothetical protein